jgi:hypothetical protein
MGGVRYRSTRTARALALLVGPLVVFSVMAFVTSSAEANTRPAVSPGVASSDWAGSGFCATGAPKPAPYTGNSFAGVAACGTAYGDGGNSNEQGPVSYDGVQFDSVGFQCVELVMRYMYYDFGSAPYYANGDSVVSNYHGSLFTKEIDPAADGLPSVGDILSFAGTSSNKYGHTAIVIGVGSSSLTTLNENDTASGLDTVPVSNGVVGGGVTGWLHVPDNRTPPAIASFTASSPVASGSGSTIQLTAAASNATEYSFTSSDSGVQGLSTVSSTSGSAQVEIMLPQENNRTSTVSFTVAVSGPGGTTTASTSVIQYYGSFTTSGTNQVLYYFPGDQGWSLGTIAKGKITFTGLGNSAGFGNTAGDPTFIGDFTGSGSDQVLYYFPGDQGWSLGTIAKGKITFTSLGNSAGFGNTAADPTFIGDFSGVGKDQVLYYFPGDEGWSLGTIAKGKITFSSLGNSAGFGNTAGDPTFIGDFSGVGKDQVLYYFPGDEGWSLGTITKGKITFTSLGNSAGFGNTAADPTFVGDFSGVGKDQVLYYFPGDQGWSLGTIAKGKITFTSLGNSAGFGNTAADPTFIGDFSGVGKDQVLYYFPGDQGWSLGTINKGKITFSALGNSAGFGNTAADPTYIGDFSGTGKDQVLYYFPGDQGWSLGTIAKGKITFSGLGNSAGFGNTAGDPMWVF